MRKIIAYELVLYVVIGLVIAGCILALPACSSPPTAQQQMTTNVVVDAAVAVAVQNGTNDPVVWRDRAVKIVSIVKQLQAVDQGSIATFPALTATLQPMVAKLNLPPADQLAANVLIASLSQVIDQQKGKVDPDTQMVVQYVLTLVLDAANVYIPVTPKVI